MLSVCPPSRSKLNVKMGHEWVRGGQNERSRRPLSSAVAPSGVRPGLTSQRHRTVRSTGNCRRDPATGAVQRLRLHGVGLAGTLAPSLARLPALESVSLFGNALSGGIPAGYASLAPTRRRR
ncbi:unnamed protein product [Triticum turgidum subsp. durum]|uniref:Uncharacterized protein n=1 Tax=Triticum turgidum subsp. durum TaxID=4567 RepID=A0A9R1RAL4_TRITD|nr:unnamed protein product [Triticum turgidum subsp. durum]